MQDQEIITKLIGPLKAGFSAQNLSQVQILQNYQTIADHRHHGLVLKIHKIRDEMIGQPYKTNIYQANDDYFITRTIRQGLCVMRFCAFCQDKGLSAHKLLNLTIEILSEDVSLAHLSAMELRPVKFGPITTLPFSNEQGLYEQSPYFDLELTHKFISESRSPAAQIVKGKFA